MFKQKHLKQFMIEPGTKVNLKDHPTDWCDTDDAKELGKDVIKNQAKEILEQSHQKLDEAQELLYASDSHSVLLIFQAMDAAGKDSTIRHVMRGVNPQGCQVYSFKKPSAEELDHDFLWRCTKCLPERGRIGIFNRSYYEDVLVVKVHPEWLDLKLDHKPDKKFWENRYEDINNFEKHLTRNGTLILKFYLHVSKDEQKRRFLERLTNPKKYWKFSEADLPEREHWKEYRKAFEDAISATSTKIAPWYVIPADRKYMTHALVADIIACAIKDLDLKFPHVPPEKMAALEAARKALQQHDNDATPDPEPAATEHPAQDAPPLID